ncbi:MAG: hypothetical protein IKN38_10520 [Clostridia bacterium]|nr:hypothetical protein [Clostridia bacterium]
MLTLNKKIVCIVLVVMTFLFCLISCRNNQSDSKSTAEEANSVVYIRFLAYVNDELSLCHFRVDEKNNLYSSYESADYGDYGFETKECNYVEIDLNENKRAELESIVEKLDNSCMTRVIAIIEDPPMIYIKLNTGYEGAFIYGEPENSAFNEIVTFMVDCAPYEITDNSGNHFYPLSIPDDFLGTDEHPLLTKNSD